MSTLLRPTTTVVGAFVALIGTAYDFTDERTGQRNQGTSYKAYVLELSDDGKPAGVHEIRVSKDHMSAASGLKFGQAVACDLAGFAKQRGRGAIVEWTLARVIDAKTGDVLVAPLARSAA